MQEETNLFLELELPDVHSKLRELLSLKGNVKVWEDTHNFSSLKMSSVEDKFFTLSKSNDSDFINNEGEYFISFSQREMQYYFKAGVELADGEIKVTPVSKIYRSERRKELRLLTFPKINAYLYIDFEQEVDDVPENVISFNRAKAEEEEFFKKFDKDLKGLPQISGVKVLDISKEGLSFICSKSEFRLIENTQPALANLMVNGTSYKLSELTKMYDVDYLDTRIESVSLKKVGVSFNSEDHYRDLIDNLQDDSIVLTSLDEEFQKFIEK